MKPTDPMERLIYAALEEIQEPFVMEQANPAGLDFYLINKGIYIEVKQFHSDRISEQMSRAPNVIVAQGRPAVQMLADLIRAWKPNRVVMHQVGEALNQAYPFGYRSEDNEP